MAIFNTCYVKFAFKYLVKYVHALAWKLFDYRAYCYIGQTLPTNLFEIHEEMSELLDKQVWHPNTKDCMQAHTKCVMKI